MDAFIEPYLICPLQSGPKVNLDWTLKGADHIVIDLAHAKEPEPKRDWKDRLFAVIRRHTA